MRPSLPIPAHARVGRGTAPSWPLALLLVGLSAACASYPTRTRQALRDFEGGQLQASEEAFADLDVTGSSFLAGAESGTVALTEGEWQDALDHLDVAAQATADIDARGLLGPEKLAEGLESWVLNDTTQAYEGEGFERVYLHASLAMAYLGLGKLDDVYVEARKSNQLLETEEKLYEKKYKAGGLGHFVSALAYELIGQPDQAYIDYQRMVEKDVGTALAGKALVRLAAVLGRDDDLARWRERFGDAPERPADAASVVVIGGVGLAPFKVEGSILIPTPDGLIPIAAPAYQQRPQPVSELRLTDRSSGGVVVTDVLERVDEIASENLQDRLLWTTTKSVARGVLKRELTKKLQRDHGLAGRVAGDLFAAISERADLRSWTTLPASWQAGRLWVPPGPVDLVLDAPGAGTIELGGYRLDPGETLIVLARTVGTRVYAYAIGGQPLESPAAIGALSPSPDVPQAAVAAGVPR